MMYRILFCALVAGMVAGVAVTAAQLVSVIPLIEAAEAIEAGGAAPHHDGPGLLETTLSNILVGAGFGFLLVGTVAMVGRPVDGKTGLIWGAGGFLAFVLMPALGLPPTPPGAPRPPLGDAQSWWLLCVGLTAAGLLLGAFSKRWALRLAALALVAAPHVYGAPAPAGEAPDALAAIIADFRLAAIASSAVFWLALGGAAGLLYPRIVAVQGRN